MTVSPKLWVKALLAVLATLGAFVMAASPAAAATAKLTSMSDEFANLSSTTSYSDGMVFGNWTTVFAGYGYVKGSGGYLTMAPRAVTSPDATSAALVVSRTGTTASCLTVSSRVATTAQLRTGSAPNPWEVGWLVWDYVDNEHFTYLAVKTNGWEVGRRDPVYPGGQRFIATGSNMATPVGQYRTIDVRRTATTTTVKLDGTALATYTMANAAERYGKVGMYTEDSAVSWDFLRSATC